MNLWASYPTGRLRLGINRRPPMIDTTEELSEVLRGHSIESVEFHEDGLHLNVSNGQTLVFLGVEAVGLLDVEVTLQ